VGAKPPAPDKERAVTAPHGWPSTAVTQPHWTLVAPAALRGEYVAAVRRPEHLDDARAANPGVVVYLEAELRELEGRSPDLIRAVHRTKKCLDATVIPRDSALGNWCAARVAIPVEKLLGHDKENDTHE